MVIKRKMIRPEVKVLDVKNGRVHAVVSSEKQDRDRDILRADFWDLNNFHRYSPLIESHNYFDVRSVIGEWEDMDVVKSRKTLEGVAQYYVGQGNEKADWAFNLAMKRRAVYSVGFIPDMSKAKLIDKDDPFGGYEFRGQELVEASQVTIPSNPDALQRIAGISELHPEFKALINETLVDETLEDKTPSEALDQLNKVLRPLLDEYKTLIADEIMRRIDESFTRVSLSENNTESIDYGALISEAFSEVENDNRSG